jgi:multidrug efflux pump subunit AcrB
MNLAAIAIEKRAVTYFVLFLLLTAGVASFFALGQLEDPEFTVKTAVITTSYPGASPAEVELEVTDRIEIALQELKQIEYLESFSMAGFSLIKVNIEPEYWADRLPQVWDEMRRKVRDVETQLPPGADRPVISDDFGDVFGFQLAVTGDGYSYSELERFVKALRKELSLVEGVARVDLWGNQQQVIYVDASETQLSQLGMTDQNIAVTLQTQNLVVDAGSVDVQTNRLRIAPTGDFLSVEDIGNLNVRPTLLDTLQNLTPSPERRSTELIKIRDIGTVRRGYIDPPVQLMRYDDIPAIGISITNVSGINVVDMGRAVDARLKELIGILPVGIEVHKVHWQSDVVAEAINGFLISFAQAVGIVLVVLTLFMGWRLGMIIGFALIATILGSFMLMAIFGIDLQRMSLGALVIALGMMVDNAIVVADGYVVRLKKGMKPNEAAIEAAQIPAWPLLGATVVAVMAFYPIYASIEDAGEYCRSLFSVVAISLLVSWVVSVTLTPLQCIDLIKPRETDDEEKDPYAGRFFQMFRGLLERAIRFRVLTVGGVTALLVVSLVAFGGVKQQFFPDSSMTKFMIDYWAPQGTRIQQVSADLSKAEAHILEDERVESVAGFIGAGPPRFYLPVDPENPNANYGQVIVNVHDFRDIDDIMEGLELWFDENLPNAIVPLRKYGVGPSNTWKFEFRISGPAVASPGILRSLAGEVTDILDNEPLAAYRRTDWSNRVLKVVPEFNEERGRWSVVSRDDLANTTKRAYDGRTIGLYRELDDLIPIVVRSVEEERQAVGEMGSLQVQSSLSTETVPVDQVTDHIATEWEDPMIWRRDRRRTITVQSNPIAGETLPSLRGAVLAQIEAIEPPPGYSLEWGGEYEDTVDAQQSLIPGVIPAVAIIGFIIVALFNAFRPPLVIVLTIPFAAIGISIGLLATNTPFGFLALLGAMSLAGMMIKNAIVLLDEININLAAGRAPYDAVVEAALSRLRPVVLAAATTVLGVIPLLQDVFWIGMAVTLMAGLSFGTLLTMFIVPTLYTIFYRIRSPG